MWEEYLAFLVVAGLPLPKVNHFVILAYMEYLVANGCSPSNISNNVAGIRTHFIIHCLDTLAFRLEQIASLHKSLKRNTPFAP